MPEILKSPFANGIEVQPAHVLVRLLLALLLGCIVAWIYRRTTRASGVGSSFPLTLVLLSVLIAIVTQVIGDNVARAFSLVGALSIVRFRTVVRDTKDTAYVIFAVVVGMAVGAQNLWVAAIGIGIIGLTAFVVAARTGSFQGSEPVYLLTVRVASGFDPEELTGKILSAHVAGREVTSICTARQGTAVDVTYETRLVPGVSAHELVKLLNRMEGVQEVRMQRRGMELD
jgi:hypothetical protein